MLGVQKSDVQVVKEGFDALANIERLSMKRILLFMFFVWMFCSQIVHAASVMGTLTVFRATIDDAVHKVEERNIILFKMSSELHANCTWLFIPKDNNYFASTLLSAQARNKEIRVWYDQNNPIASICKAYTVEVGQ